jgi:hypothetical protein
MRIRFADQELNSVVRERAVDVGDVPGWNAGQL